MTSHYTYQRRGKVLFRKLGHHRLVWDGEYYRCKSCGTMLSVRNGTVFYYKNEKCSAAKFKCRDIAIEEIIC